ncbi:YicC/YloC family endoribonuclease [Cochlodiniinecator piscidefendens]|uniref:YicC/YloC family endoribonuclease n=1 Tax=Cochlodiniinecator piscidefendens TaxID=2715756 RepID=UPI001E5C8E4D|nr:YicC/YloC family endoribonuclease [Cochlodiniinecator piscidefendens]
MTGFASGRGDGLGFDWSWEIRSVNAKGLDLRLRVPDWVEGLEQSLRKAMTAQLGRGSVTLNLRLSREAQPETHRLNEQALERTLAILSQVEEAASKNGFSLAKTTASDVLSQRGVLELASDDADTNGLLSLLTFDFESVLADFCQMRAQEGAALNSILSAQVDNVAIKIAKAYEIAVERKDEMAQNLRANLAGVLDNTDAVDEGRLAQELALIVVKADITEELDRLEAHVVAARDLLAKSGPVGRKFDFLMQEFNREVNTLCSKSQNKSLTTLGLDLKVLIDQMREQVQNVE